MTTESIPFDANKPGHLYLTKSGRKAISECGGDPEAVEAEANADCPARPLEAPQSPPRRSPSEMTNRELRDACRAYRDDARRDDLIYRAELLAEIKRRWRI
jgi:hypothetical protein